MRIYSHVRRTWRTRHVRHMRWISRTSCGWSARLVLLRSLRSQWLEPDDGRMQKTQRVDVALRPGARSPVQSVHPVGAMSRQKRADGLPSSDDVPSGDRGLDRLVGGADAIGVDRWRRPAAPRPPRRRPRSRLPPRGPESPPEGTGPHPDDPSPRSPWADRIPGPRSRTAGRPPVGGAGRMGARRCRFRRLSWRSHCL